MEPREGGGDFNIACWPQDYGPKPGKVVRARGWWRLIRGDLRPFLSFELTIEGTKYGFAVFPRRPDSYPTAKIIRRELLRESAVRALEGGEIEIGELPESEE